MLIQIYIPPFIVLLSLSLSPSDFLDVSECCMHHKKNNRNCIFISFHRSFNKQSIETIYFFGVWCFAVGFVDFARKHVQGNARKHSNWSQHSTIKSYASKSIWHLLFVHCGCKHAFVVQWSCLLAIRYSGDHRSRTQRLMWSVPINSGVTDSSLIVFSLNTSEKPKMSCSISIPSSGNQDKYRSQTTSLLCANKFRTESTEIDYFAFK